MTAAQLNALSDNEIGTLASGGYGPKRRNEFYASLRAALDKAQRVEAMTPVEQLRRSVEESSPARA